MVDTATPPLDEDDVEFGVCLGRALKPRAAELELDLDEPEEDPFAAEEVDELEYGCPPPIDSKLPLSKRLEIAFPFPSIRPVQQKALAVIAEAKRNDNRFIIIEAPTGSGKSPLGFAAARAFGEGYYLTSQNSLSSQMMRDFAPLGLRQIKGQTNYLCRPHHTDCKNGTRRNKAGERAARQGDGQEINSLGEAVDLSGAEITGNVCAGCPYRMRKQEFKDASVGVTNYAYLIIENQFARELKARSLLVCDEAHNVEKEIIARLDIKVTPKKCEEVGCGAIPLFRADQEAETRRWLEQTFCPGIPRRSRKYEKEAQYLEDTGKQDDADKIWAKVDALGSLLWQIEQFLEGTRSEWIAYSDSAANLLIKPLSVATFAEKMLFSKGRSVLLMSATILDFNTLTRTLGIAKEDVSTFAVPSDFPVENRRIVFWPVGNMSFKYIDETLPKLNARIEKLLTRWPDTKGIIHTHTYRINTQLQDFLRHTVHHRRIITHTNVTGDREKAIKRHIESPEPTVLLSPSMTEGLDLKDDLSRFQILCKVPFPFLDPYTQERKSRDAKWYQLQTALTIVQASGRSVRSATDYAVTIILDSAFESFLAWNQHILPQWWKAAIEFKN
jgi:ATP-dependent DNA helicase DinG